MIEHKTISLADQVFEHLEKDILIGKYKRGDILTESHLSAELGVSRTPIREALRRLGQEHLIEETGKGSLVLGITEKDLMDIFKVREQLEGMAAAMACKNATDEEIQELKNTVELQEFYLTKRDAEQIKTMDNKFHETLYKLCGSMTFYNILTPLHNKVQKYRKAAIESKNRAEASVEEHYKIYEAIKDRDENKASLMAMEHVKNAYRHIRREEK